MVQESMSSQDHMIMINSLGLPTGHFISPIEAIQDYLKGLGIDEHGLTDKIGDRYIHLNEYWSGEVWQIKNIGTASYWSPPWIFVYERTCERESFAYCMTIYDWEDNGLYCRVPVTVLLNKYEKITKDVMFKPGGFEWSKYEKCPKCSIRSFIIGRCLRECHLNKR